MTAAGVPVLDARFSPQTAALTKLNDLRHVARYSLQHGPARVALAAREGPRFVARGGQRRHS